jgi:hypothetical protein
MSTSDVQRKGCRLKGTTTFIAFLQLAVVFAGGQATKFTWEQLGLTLVKSEGVQMAM